MTHPACHSHGLLPAALATVLAFACGAPPSPGGDDDGDTTTTGADEVGSSTSTTTTTTGEPDAEPLPDPFDLNREAVRLLPFQIRFKRLQQLTGLAPDDPAFAVLLARRYDLGDYNHALGVNPDLTWTATRMSAWIAAMRPICTSEAMKARFPSFPDALDDLLLAAYGVAPGADDLAQYEDLLGDATFDEPTRHELVCAVALSALEFVAQ